jgi:putative transposase
MLKPMIDIPLASLKIWHGSPVAIMKRDFSGSARSQRPRKPSRIDPHGRTWSGTASQRLSAARWSTWRLDQPELSPRELAVRFTDEQEYFVSEASVYRLLKAHDLITSPAYTVIKAAEAFKD